MERFSFCKDEKIRNRRDFQIISDRGTRRRSEHFVVLSLENKSGAKRLGITVSKKVGNAVRRNRIKRLVREFFRLNKARLPGARDIVVIARKHSACPTYRQVCRELAELLIPQGDDVQACSKFCCKKA